MLDAAFTLLACAASLGAFLALGFLREGDAAPPAARAPRPRLPRLGLVHAGLGGTGLLVLLAALHDHNTAIHPAAGVAGFGSIAAALIGIALLFGLSILATARAGRGRASILIAVHATLAISGLVVLIALVSLG